MSRGKFVTAAMIAELLPAHKASLSIIHNKHLDYYESAKTQIERDDDYYHPDSFPEGERDKCITANEIWTLHYYPETPIGFNLIHASKLEALLRAIPQEPTP